MKRFGLVILAIIFAASLGGCSCLKKEVKEEAPPPAKVAAPVKAPEPTPPPPAPKKVRN
jgi:hypothetical protein